MDMARLKIFERVAGPQLESLMEIVGLSGGSWRAEGSVEVERRKDSSRPPYRVQKIPTKCDALNGALVFR